ncbi:hypothetical protein BGX38DRAFT_1232961, partial [Terfezia claveryi]
APILYALPFSTRSHFLRAPILYASIHFHSLRIPSSGFPTYKLPFFTRSHSVNALILYALLLSIHFHSLRIPSSGFPTYTLPFFTHSYSLRTLFLYALSFSIRFHSLCASSSGSILYALPASTFYPPYPMHFWLWLHTPAPTFQTYTLPAPIFLPSIPHAFLAPAPYPTHFQLPHSYAPYPTHSWLWLHICPSHSQLRLPTLRTPQL